MQLKNNFSSIVIMVNIALYFTVMIFFSSLFLPRDYMNGLISSKIEAVTITIALVISTACLYLMPNKTALGLKYLNETLGFKKFLEGADENKIHILAKKLPKYCYNVLSYAVALDIGTMWVKKIEKVILKQPAWFIGPFNAEAIDNLTKSFIEAMDKYIKK